MLFFKRNWPSLALIFTSIVFLLIGTISRGEHLIILEKAIRICLECIGIG